MSGNSRVVLSHLLPSSPQHTIHKREIVNENERAPCSPRWHDHSVLDAKIQATLTAESQPQKTEEKGHFLCFVPAVCGDKRIHAHCRELLQYSTEETCPLGPVEGCRPGSGTLGYWGNAFISPSHGALICQMVASAGPSLSC